MKKLIIALMLFTGIVQAQEIRYDQSYADLRNPERGFYHQLSTWSTEPGDTYNYKLLNAGDITYCNNHKITLIQRLVRLDNYKAAATIDPNFLNKLVADLSFLKTNGLKCILRFTYADYEQKTQFAAYFGSLDPANIYEPTKSILMGHLSQIKARFALSPDNEGAISSMEAGFIGNWGEWYYSKSTTYGGTPVSEFGIGDPDQLDAQVGNTYRGNRKTIAEEIMKIAPTRMVAFRTPYFQKLLAPSNNQGKQAPFYNGTDFSRIACHNDAFVSNVLDDGTYRETVDGVNDPYGSIDRSYLKAKSKHTFTGGESNFYDVDENHSFATCIPAEVNIAQNPLNKTAIQQMEDYHYNYLNETYYPDIMNVDNPDYPIGIWVTTPFPSPANGNCLNEVKRRLGYRFVLEKSYVTQIGTTPNYKLTIELKNVGFANVFNKRKAYLVLKSSGGTLYRLYINGPADFNSSNPPAPGVILGTDVRSWDAYDFNTNPPVQPAGPIKLTKTLTNLTTFDNITVPDGTYELYLELPDETFTSNAKHSIQFANANSYSKVIGGNVVSGFTGTFYDPNTGLNNLFRSITITSGVGSKMTEGSIAFNVISSPNPFNTTFKLNIQTSSEESINVKVYDMLGKLVESPTITANELESLEIGSKLSTGVYNVLVKQGENEKTVRVIKN